MYNPWVESEAISVWICTFHKTETQIRVWIIYETDRILLIIIAWYLYLWQSKKSMGCIVFYLIPTPCKSDEILAIIRVISIIYQFMWMTSQILNTVLDTLETRKIGCHSLGCYRTGCVKNFNSDHKINILYPSKSRFKIFMIFHFFLIKGVSFDWKFSQYLLFICRVCPNICINLFIFSIWKPLIY